MAKLVSQAKRTFPRAVMFYSSSSSMQTSRSLQHNPWTHEFILSLQCGGGWAKTKAGRRGEGQGGHQEGARGGLSGTRRVMSSTLGDYQVLEGGRVREKVKVVLRKVKGPGGWKNERVREK